MSNSADNSNNEERHSEHSAETAEARSDEFTPENAADSSMHDPSLESGIDALLAAEPRDGTLASSRQEGDGPREVFAPAVVFGDLNSLVLGKINGELCRYDLSSFGPLTPPPTLEHELDQELQRARKEAITMRYGTLAGEEGYRSTFLPIEREDEEPSQLGDGPSEASEVAGDLEDEKALELHDGVGEEWAETRYSDAFLRDIADTSAQKSEVTEYEVKPFSAYEESAHPIDLIDEEGQTPTLVEEVSEDQPFAPSTTIQTGAISAIINSADNDSVAGDMSQPELVESLEEMPSAESEEVGSVIEPSQDALAVTEEETVELERAREEETVDLRRNRLREEVGSPEELFHAVGEPSEGGAPADFASEEDSPLELEESSSPAESLEFSDEDLSAEEASLSGHADSDTEVLDLNEETDAAAEEEASRRAEKIAEVRQSLTGTMRLEAVTYIDAGSAQAADAAIVEGSEPLPPPPIRARGEGSVIPSQGPPPKHRPVPKEPVVSPVATAPPAPRASGRKSRPAGPPPKRRTTGEMRAERRTPPAISINTNSEPTAGPPPKRPPTQGPPNRPPQQGQPGPGRGVHPKQPVVVASKSSGDPQMDEIIQQLIDENKRKEVASAESGGVPPNARVEWFTNYFGDDYLRSISPKQQQRTKREIEFMLRSLRPSPGASLLDAACGYGRHSLEFAQRGYEVVGVDLSMTMLKRALNESNKRSAQLKKNLSVRFMQGDMRDIDYQSEFDCALLWQDSLGYFDNLGDADAVGKIYHSLKPGGRFLLDVTNRDYVVSLLPTRRIWFGVQAEIHEEVFFDSPSSLLFMKRTYLTNNRGVVRDYLSRIRLYSLHELLNLLRFIGFNILEVSGDILYRGHHLDHCSPRNIILAERPR